MSLRRLPLELSDESTMLLDDLRVGLNVDDPDEGVRAASQLLSNQARLEQKSDGGLPSVQQSLSSHPPHCYRPQCSCRHQKQRGERRNSSLLKSTTTTTRAKPI